MQKKDEETKREVSELKEENKKQLNEVRMTIQNEMQIKWDEYKKNAQQEFRELARVMMLAQSTQQNVPLQQNLSGTIPIVATTLPSSSRSSVSSSESPHFFSPANRSTMGTQGYQQPGPWNNESEKKGDSTIQQPGNGPR